MSIEIIKTDVTTKGEKRQKIRKWILRLALGLMVLGPLTFILAALGAKLGLWGWKFGLLTLSFKIGPLILLGSLGVGVISLLLAFYIKPRKGFAIAALAILIPVIGLGQLKATQKKAGSLPFIHDITTNTQDVPTFTDVILSERAKVQGVNTVDYVGKKDKPDGKLVSVLQSQAEAYADIRPLILSDTPEVVFGQAKAAIRQMGWALKSEDVKTGLIEATETTFWYGFEDDIVVRLRPSEGGGTVLDVRSISRIGGSDIGANAERIRKFLKLMGKA